MTKPKNLTPEESKEWYRRRWQREKAHMIAKGTYDEYRRKEAERHQIWYKNLTPEQREHRNEIGRRVWERRKNDPNYIAQHHKSTRESAYRRSNCYGCEFWKLIPTPLGCAGGAFHYCKKYPQATSPWKRKHTCERLKKIINDINYNNNGNRPTIG